MHQCIICLGSNYEAEKNINTALDRLENEFDIIEWGEAIYTPAEGTAKESTYLNRVAFRFSLLNYAFLCRESTYRKE